MLGLGAAGAALLGLDTWEEASALLLAPAGAALLGLAEAALLPEGSEAAMLLAPAGAALLGLAEAALLLAPAGAALLGLEELELPCEAAAAALGGGLRASWRPQARLCWASPRPRCSWHLRQQLHLQRHRLWRQEVLRG